MMMTFLVLIVFLSVSAAKPGLYSRRPAVPMAFASQSSKLCTFVEATNRNNAFRILNSEGNDDEKQPDVDQDIGTPIELESLQNPTLFGIEKKQDADLLDTGVPTFTGVIVLAYSIFFIYTLLSDDIGPLDVPSTSLPFDGQSSFVPGS